MKLYRFIVLIVVALAVLSCHRGATELKEQDIRLAPGDYVMDAPDSVAAYFETLCRDYGATICVHSDDSGTIKVWHAVHLLDDFAAGRRQYYPAAEVRRALDIMAFGMGYGFSHGPYLYWDDEVVFDTNYSEIFFFRFLEQAARLSPQVDFVTDFHCADGTAGILNYSEWSPNPMYSFLIYPSESGLRVQMVDSVGNTKITRLFRLTDEAGREYYLCSNNGLIDAAEDRYGIGFRQFLFMRDGEVVKKVASYVGYDYYSDDEGALGLMVFNPRLLRWDLCHKKGDTYFRVDNGFSIRLYLDGENSRFEENDGAQSAQTADL